MDENPEPSWTNAIRSAVKDFVDAVNESSKQLASASERFALESLHAADEARSRSERSAATSMEMAERARQAADEARNATSSLQSAVDEAREQVRNEARLSIEQVSLQTAQINDIGAQVKNDLQQRIDEMVARLEAGAAGHQEALETAQAATAAAQAAAQRIEMSVNAVEAAVTRAREAAETARSAADKSEQHAGSTSMAVTSAQEAAEASRHSASLAEQAGQRSDFAAEASMLLERLETDYSLLTRLVQELHSRISSLSAVTVAPPAQSYQPEADESQAIDEAPSETPDNTNASSEYEIPSYGSAATSGVESAATEEGPAEEALAEEAPGLHAISDFAAQQIDAGPVSPWPSQPPVDIDMPSAVEEPVMPEPVMPVTPEVTMPAAVAAPSITIFGRVQVTAYPVPDFDRLLSLDSALARVKGVQSVTLADYAREEVIFRIDLQRPVSVVEFAHELSETAGVGTEVTEASENTLSIRIG